MGRTVDINQAVLLELKTFDGNTSRGVQARVYNSAGTEQVGSPFTLTHFARGNYRNVSWTPTVSGEYVVNYEVFTDGTFVTLDTNYTQIAEVVGVRSTSPALRDGTLQSATSTTATLDTGASASDNYYRHTIIEIISGTGAGQSRFVTGYVGSTKVATVATAWVTNPDSSSKFKIKSFGNLAYQVLTNPTQLLLTNASGHTTPADGSLTAAKFAVDSITSSALATSAVTEIVTAIFGNSIDGKTFTEISEIILAYATGRIVKSGASYEYRKQDNSTPLFTLNASATERTRS